MERELKIGQTLVSQVDATTVVVVRVPQRAVTVACGGVDMVDAKEPREGRSATTSASPGTTLLGKRYADDDAGLELLCTKGGDHALTADGAVLPLKAAKALPASD